MQTDIIDEIIKLQNKDNWEACIDLCRKALEERASYDLIDNFGIYLSLALSLLSTEENMIDNREEAIDIYRNLLLHTNSNTNKWAKIQKNLGYAFSVRLKGDKNHNKLQSIQHNQAALNVYRSMGDKETWANLKAEIGFAYLGVVSDKPKENLLEACKHFKESLSVFNESEYKVEYKEITEAIQVCERKLKKRLV